MEDNRGLEGSAAILDRPDDDLALRPSLVEVVVVQPGRSQDPVHPTPVKLRPCRRSIEAATGVGRQHEAVPQYYLANRM